MSTGAQNVGTLITGRRNFIVKALGFTAAGATLSVPIITAATAREKVAHHVKGLQDALLDLYGADVTIRATHYDPPPGHMFLHPDERGIGYIAPDHAYVLVTATRQEAEWLWPIRRYDRETPCPYNLVRPGGVAL